MFIDDYEDNLDRQFMNKTAQKLFNSMDNKNIQERYNQQVNEFLDYVRQKQMIRRARQEQQTAQVEVDTTQARKEIENLLSLFK